MNQSRRSFLKKLPVAMSLPFTVAGIPINLMAENSLTKMARSSFFNNDRVLIILQMHGGNDGLNTLIPVDDYEQYYSLRANIAIPSKNSIRKYIAADSTLPLKSQFGFHPDMQAMKTMYDQGRVSIIQGVSYENNNGSHFRGRDILFMGGSADDYLQSGWVGRYLQQVVSPFTYPENFPLKKGDDPNDFDRELLDPLAIEMGSDVSLIFHQQGSIPTSISIDDPESFAELVDDLDGFKDELIDPRGVPPEQLKTSPYYNELHWILSLEDKSKDYAARLAQVYRQGEKVEGYTSYPTTYPFNAPKGSLRNPLSHQLQVVAKLLSGGCQTKVFLVKIGGFDTHADQVESYDPTMGGHAALLYHISTAMNAFQEDLRKRGLEDRVLTMTTSEFGRRARSNGSYGTDHGTACPVMLFGKGVNPGVIGDALALQGDNLAKQIDYRIVYGNIVKDWLQVTDVDKLDEIFPGLMKGGTSDGVTFEELPIISHTITGTEDFIGDRFSLEECHPNPAKTKTTVRFRVNSTNHVSIELFDKQGRKAGLWINDTYAPGEHKVDVDVTDLPAGNYIYQMKSGFFKDSRKLVVVK